MDIEKLIAESHAAQLDGKDYQAVAIEIAKREGIKWESDTFNELQSSPDPGCECVSCQKYYNS